MTKKEKVEYINDVYFKFADARNHGGHGHWWYPKPDRIAYNVKMHSFGNSDTLREIMTDRQNDYYTDEDLWEIMDRMVWEEAEMYIEYIKESFEYVEDAGMYGRSGGWLEVDYNNTLEQVDEDTDMQDINHYYKEAKALEESEEQVRQDVIKAHKQLNDYIDSKEYYNDLLEMLMDDNSIAKVYKGRIKNLTDKLK